MTKTLLMPAAATGLALAAMALPQLASAQATTDPAAVSAPVTAPAAVAPTTAPATTAYPGAAATYPASTAYPAASYPPPMPGAVTGSVAADRDGDGIVDGYYTSDGIYHPNNAAPSLPPPRLASRRGERG